MCLRQGLLQKSFAGIIMQVQPILAQLKQLMLSQAQPIAMTLSFVGIIYISVLNLKKKSIISAKAFLAIEMQLN